VSTDGQLLDDQIAELKAATKIFAEKQSDARSDRPQLKKSLASLGEGDTLIVTPSLPERLVVYTHCVY
jgi:DNA invertase Pin-like site-specific DNA recombinase